MQKITFRTQSKLGWVLIIFHMTFFFFKADIHYTIKYGIHTMYGIQYTIHAIVYVCVLSDMAAQGSDVIKGVKPPKFRKEYWKKYKESNTGLCPMKICVCAYDSSCKWLKEKGNTSEWSYMDSAITETKYKSNV